MNDTLQHPANAPATRVPFALKLLGGTAVFVALLALLLVFFPWDWLRGPLNRYVSDRTGRHFEITRKLDVQLGRTVRVLADGIEFANPEWARDPHLVKAEAAQIDVRLWPLFRGRVELPLINLTKPQLSLQVEADGRRSWALGRDTSDPGNLPEIGALVVDEGSMHFVAAADGADIRTDFAIMGTDAAGTSTTANMPLSFKAKGTWKKASFAAEGRAGNVLALSTALQEPFPARVSLSAGDTRLRAAGTVASLKTLDGAQVDVDLQGNNLADLYKLVGVVLPETPRYALRGHLTKSGEVWQVSRINGKLGNSDLSGDLAFDRSQPVPLLRGKLQSKSLDFDDLAPLVGLPEQARSAQAMPQVAAAPAVAAAQPRAVAAREREAQRKVLPTAMLDVARLKAMNADVRYSALRVSHVQQIPLDRMATHVVLKDGVLLLDELDLGVAGGRLAGRLRIDGNSNPAVASVKLDARALELNRLFPGFEKMQASLGRVHGEIDLKGRGNSVAQMLGTSSGDVALLMGRGEISNILLEFAGLDGGEVIKFMLRGDRNVQLRCAATSFGVEDGLMSTRAFVLDTADTVIYGTGGISLANEAMDLTLRPYPKDSSILSFRSPLKVSGTFAAPKAGIDKGALSGRAGLALALGAVNPLLALAATIETGPGKDADCGEVLRQAAAPEAAARIAATAPPPQSGASAPERVMGAPATPSRAEAAATRPGAHYPLDKPAGKPVDKPAQQRAR